MCLALESVFQDIGQEVKPSFESLQQRTQWDGASEAELIGSVPIVETQTPSPRSLAFPPTETLNPPHRPPGYSSSGVGGSQQLFSGLEQGLRNNHPAPPWGTWCEGVWGETTGYSYFMLIPKSQPQSSNLSPVSPLHTPFKEYLN